MRLEFNMFFIARIMWVVVFIIYCLKRFENQFSRNRSDFLIGFWVERIDL